jgi:hypothetical protein
MYGFLASPILASSHILKKLRWENKLQNPSSLINTRKTWKLGSGSITTMCDSPSHSFTPGVEDRYRSFATRLSRFKTCDFSGEEFKGSEVL